MDIVCMSDGAIYDRVELKKSDDIAQYYVKYTTIMIGIYIIIETFELFFIDFYLKYL